MSDGLIPNPRQILGRAVRWDWEMIALLGIGILAVANLFIFVRERTK